MKLVLVDRVRRSLRVSCDILGSMKNISKDAAETCANELRATLASLEARAADARLMQEECEDLLIALERRILRVEAALKEFD